MVKRKTSANKSRKRKGRRQRPLTKTKTKHNTRKKKSSKKKNSKSATRKITSPRKPLKRTKLKPASKEVGSTVHRKSKKSSSGTKPRQSNKSSRPKRYFSKRGRPPSLDRVRRTIAEVDGTTVKPISKPSNTEIKSLRNENKKKLVEKPQEGLFENYVERLRRHAILGE